MSTRNCQFQPPQTRLGNNIERPTSLAHQNRTIAIASDFRVDGAKSPEIPQKEGSEIAARNRRSLATFHRTLKSQCIIAVSCLGNRAISGVRDGHHNRKSQKSLRFRCAKPTTEATQTSIFPGSKLRSSSADYIAARFQRFPVFAYRPNLPTWSANHLQDPYAPWQDLSS